MECKPLAQNMSPIYIKRISYYGLYDEGQKRIVF